MRHAALVPVLLCSCLARAGLGSESRVSRTPITSSVKGLEVSPEVLRIRVRALIRPAVGIIEENADRIRAETEDPQMRRRRGRPARPLSQGVILPTSSTTPGNASKRRTYRSLRIGTASASAARRVRSAPVRSGSSRWS